MKTLTTFLLILAFMPIFAQAHIWPKTVLRETECYICGKTIQERKIGRASCRERV